MSDIKETLQPLAVRVVALEGAVERLIMAIQCLVDHRDRTSDDVLDLVDVYVSNAKAALEGRDE